MVTLYLHALNLPSARPVVFAAQDEVGDSDADFGDDVIFYGDVQDAADEAGANLT